MCIWGVWSGPMVKGWDSWSRNPGSIPSASGRFWFGHGVPFILTRSLRYGTKNTGCPLCVCTPHMQSKDPLCLFAKSSLFRRACGYSAAWVPWVLAPVLYRGLLSPHWRRRKAPRCGNRSCAGHQWYWCYEPHELKAPALITCTRQFKPSNYRLHDQWYLIVPGCSWTEKTPTSCCHLKQYLWLHSSSTYQVCLTDRFELVVDDLDLRMMVWNVAGLQTLKNNTATILPISEIQFTL